MDGKSVGMVSLQEPLSWRVYVDGTANQKGSGMGLVLVSPEKITIEKFLRLGFSTTNNKVEYEALLVGPWFKNGQKGRGDILGFKTGCRSNERGVKSHGCRMHEPFSLLHIPRSGNTHADSLATLATSLAQGLPRVIVVKGLCKPTKMKGERVYIH